MYRPYMNEERQKERNNTYAGQVARQLSQTACNCVSNILSQNNDYASERNEKEALRFLATVRDDFIADINISIENLEISYFGKKGSNET